MEHEIGGMPITKTEDVSDHAHDSQAAREVRAALEPHLAVATLQPQHLVKVQTGCLLQRVAKDFNLLDERKMLKIWCHLEDDPVFYGHKSFLAVAVVFDEGMQRITIRNPFNETTLWRERNDGVPLNVQLLTTAIPVIGQQGVH